MRRRETTFDLLIALPWYIAAAMGIGLYFGASSIASFIGSFSPMLAQLTPTIAELAKLLSYVVLGAGAISLVRGFLVQRKFAAQRSLQDLRALSWQDFEVMVGEAFRRQGYSVLETGQGGSDGGVDLVLMKAGQRFLVQCKQYRASSVSVMVVREIFGIVAAQRASGAIVVTTGTFTKDAIKFAKGQRIELIDGAKLEAMVRDINQASIGMSMDSSSSMPSSSRRSPSPVSSSTTPSPTTSSSGSPSPGTLITSSSDPPSCPRCDSEMVLRKPRAGGDSFYGCRAFPKCRATRPAS